MDQAQAEVNQHTIYLGNQLKLTFLKQYDVYLKLQYKRRELGFNLTIMCARYEVEITDFHYLWMITFIIPQSEKDEQQFLEDFAWTFLLTDPVLNRIGLHHLCRFQNRLGQENIDEELKAEQDKFKQEMKKRQIILLEDDDTVISQWQVFQPKDFDLDPKPFRYNEKQVIQSIFSQLDLKSVHLGKRPRVCHSIYFVRCI